MRVVFIHLGEVRADHLWLNIKRHLRLFPGVPVTLIVDNKFHPIEGLEGLIDIFFYERSSLHNEFISKNLVHGEDFRHGFWRYSTERLFAVVAYHSEVPTEKLLHVESDVLLLRGFPFERMELTSTLAWTRYNNVMDVAALVFLPNLESSTWLAGEMIKEMTNSPSHTDMTLLNVIAHNHPNIVRILPSASSKIPSLINKKSFVKSQEVELISHGADFYAGVFDPAAIGMWATGEDPRNNYGITRYLDRGILDSGDSYIDPSGVTLSYDEKDGIILSEGENSIKLWNLHVHSKNLQLFGDHWEEELINIVADLKNNQLHDDFNWRMCLHLLSENINQKTLRPYVLGMPGPAKLKRKLKSLRGHH
jgi:hypothetical protein